MFRSVKIQQPATQSLLSQKSPTGQNFNSQFTSIICSLSHKSLTHLCSLGELRIFKTGAQHRWRLLLRIIMGGTNIWDKYNFSLFPILSSAAFSMGCNKCVGCNCKDPFEIKLNSASVKIDNNTNNNNKKKRRNCYDDHLLSRQNDGFDQ